MGAPIDQNQLLDEVWGWPDDGYAWNGLSLASNVVVGTNPPYLISDFLALYPQFANFPTAIVNAYITFASASLVQARWLELWPLAMGLFIAHYLTLWQLGQSGAASPTVAQVASAGLARGVMTSKSAGDVSTSSTLIGFTQEMGIWGLTLFGQQLWSMAQFMGTGGMLII